MITVINRQKALPINKGSIAKAATEVLSFLQVEWEELSIYFVTKKRIAELHGEFFDDPTETDCISFPLDDKHLGEIFVCPEVAIDYATKHNIDPFEETLLYFIHGILHLIGYDDLDPAKKREMRKMEKKCLKHLSTQKIEISPDSYR